MDGATLYQAIGDFLAGQRLEPLPGNYALIHAMYANEYSPVAEAIKAATADGLRLSQRDADRIREELGIGAAAAAAPIPAGPTLDPGLLAAATKRVEDFVAIVEAQRVDAKSYGDDLAAGADKLEAGEGGSLAALVAVTRAMAERTKAVEAQLTAARDESEALREKLAEAGEEARSDPLTRLPNRRAFEEKLQELEAAGIGISLAICDIDHFKRVNDQYGHAVGDRVIKLVADTLRENCNGSMVARIGGEEFVVLFEGMKPKEGARILDEARDLLSARRFKVRETDSPIGRISFSAGVACARHNEGGPAIQRADELLYAAKNAGRNQVHFEGG
jgi:diguanylate cyclase